MTSEVYRYIFAPAISLEDIEVSLVLAIMSAESLYGESQVRLDAGHFLDPDQRACVIDAGTPVGRDVNRLFVGLVSREFGANAFSVERIKTFQEHTQPKEVST